MPIRDQVVHVRGSASTRKHKIARLAHRGNASKMWQHVSVNSHRPVVTSGLFFVQSQVRILSTTSLAQRNIINKELHDVLGESPRRRQQISRVIECAGHSQGRCDSGELSIRCIDLITTCVYTTIPTISKLLSPPVPAVAQAEPPLSPPFLLTCAPEDQSECRFRPLGFERRSQNAPRRKDQRMTKRTNESTPGLAIQYPDRYPCRSLHFGRRLHGPLRNCRRDSCQAERNECE